MDWAFPRSDFWWLWRCYREATTQDLATPRLAFLGLSPFHSASALFLPDPRVFRINAPAELVIDNCDLANHETAQVADNRIYQTEQSEKSRAVRAVLKGQVHNHARKYDVAETHRTELLLILFSGNSLNRHLSVTQLH